MKIAGNCHPIRSGEIYAPAEVLRNLRVATATRTGVLTAEDSRFERFLDCMIPPHLSMKWVIPPKFISICGELDATVPVDR